MMTSPGDVADVLARAPRPVDVLGSTIVRCDTAKVDTVESGQPSSTATLACKDKGTIRRTTANCVAAAPPSRQWAIRQVSSTAIASRVLAEGGNFGNIARLSLLKAGGSVHGNARA